MWSKTLSAESLQLAAVLTFVNFVQSTTGDTPEAKKLNINDPAPEDIDSLRSLIPLEDVILIVQEQASDIMVAEDGVASMFAIELDDPQEFEMKLKELISLLVTRLISNGMAYGVNKDLLDVSFNEENGFVFEPTQKAHDLYDKMLADGDV